MAIVLNNKLQQYGGGSTPEKKPSTTTYTTLQYGSTGDDVKKLQTSLGFTGADVDGIFGQKTQQAVIDFQKANNLDVDGIAGNQTLSLLYSGKANTSSGNANTGTGTVGTSSSGSAGSSVSTNTGGATNGGNTGTGTNSSYTTNGYSQEVIDAFNLLNQFSATRPGNYTPVWQDEADAYLTQYQNRDPFTYDFNSDALYNQYKDQYIQQGRMAMMDTMGQAAAMTGGYGSTYAQTVGQQAYNQQLGQLNEIMPELYGMAYDQYNQEGNKLLNMYDIYMGKEQNERQMYQDSVDNWYKEYSMLQDDANTKYNRWLNENVLDADDSDGSGGNGDNDTGFKASNVSSMSVNEILNTIYKYSERKEDTKLADFLDMCVLVGQISQDYADQLYATYKTQGKINPTDVLPLRGGGGGAKPNIETERLLW